MPDVVSVFILPPSIDALQERLQQRGQNSPSSMARRLAEAQLEISKAPDYQYIVINDDFDTAVQDMLAIFRAIRLRTDVQLTDNATVRAILSDS